VARSIACSAVSGSIAWNALAKLIFAYVAGGRRGKLILPQEIGDEEWFTELRRSSFNFRHGLMPIKDEELSQPLETLCNDAT
jgi:hypothetical protein